MLHYDRIDVSEGIGVNKKSASKECDVCYHWYFLNHSFKFQPNVCNMCHYLLIMSMNLSDIAILNIKGSDYWCIIDLISKNETINVKLNANLIEKSRTLWNVKNLFSYIKMAKEILTFGNIETDNNKFNYHKNRIFGEM